MNKNVVVTGAGQGLGFSLVNYALKQGCCVAALELSNFDELNKIKNDNLTVIKCDVSNFDNCLSAAENCGFDSVDILFNNAGIWLEKARLKLDDEKFTFDNIIPQYKVNAVGVLMITKAFMPLVLKSKTKSVINISSEAGSIKNAFRVCEYGYCMSKAAQNMASMILSNAYSEQGVKIYCIHPGWMMTPQGMAGVTTDELPWQSPDEAAEIVFKLAENRNKEDMYYEISDGELLPLPW